MGWKQAYHEKADAQLREWQDRIERCHAESDFSRRGGRTDRGQSFRRVQKAFEAARSSLDGLASAGPGDWYAAKEAVERSMMELKLALDESGVVQNDGYLTIQTHRSQVYEPFGRRS